jgi:hypothetical protein
MRRRIDSCIGMASIAAGAKNPTSNDSSLVAGSPPTTRQAKQIGNCWRTSPLA